MTSREPKTWFSIINESVHTSDDIDIGDIDAISRNFVVIKDDKVLWLKLTESQVKEKYERNTEPDPFIYFVKEHKEFFMPYKLPVIPPKGFEHKAKERPEDYTPHLYKCPLCNDVFNNEDELTKHVKLVGH
jgi:hypothetical protein